MASCMPSFMSHGVVLFYLYFAACWSLYTFASALLAPNRTPNSSLAIPTSLLSPVVLPLSIYNSYHISNVFFLSPSHTHAVSMSPLSVFLALFHLHLSAITLSHLCVVTHTALQTYSLSRRFVCSLSSLQPLCHHLCQQLLSILPACEHTSTLCDLITRIACFHMHMQSDTACIAPTTGKRTNHRALKKF